MFPFYLPRKHKIKEIKSEQIGLNWVNFYWEKLPKQVQPKQQLHVQSQQKKY